jgi:hypothetical protein
MVRGLAGDAGKNLLWPLNLEANICKLYPWAQLTSSLITQVSLSFFVAFYLQLLFATVNLSCIMLKFQQKCHVYLIYYLLCTTTTTTSLIVTQSIKNN